MEIPDLTEARQVLLSHAFDSDLVNELKDIILCSPSRITTHLRISDYEKLSNFIPLPRDNDGAINLKGARQELTNLLNNVPSFRSQNATTVCLAIASYYMEHPDQIQSSRYNTDPVWFQKITPTNSPIASPRRAFQQEQQTNFRLEE